jgi:Rieske Fe-S protein
MNDEDMQHDCAGCAAASGIGRRAFIAQSVLAVAAVALSACGDTPTAPASLDGTVDVGAHPSLAAVNGVALVSIGGSPVAIVRTGENAFVALSRICPHQGNLINTSGSGFLCSGHGAQFTLSGQWRGGQETSNMRSYAVSYDASTNTLTVG